MSSINPRIAAGALAAILAVAAPIIAYHEGYVPNTYADPIGIPTVCFGHTGPDVEWGQEYTRAQCDALLTGDGLHLNDLGYRCMAEHVAHALALGAFLRIKARPNFMQ